MTTTPPEPKQSAEAKQDPRDLILAFLMGMLFTPFLGMLRALAYRLLWGWFLAPQYGDGPTLQAWFGVGVLYTLISYRKDESEGDLKHPVRYMFERVFLDVMMLGAMMLAAAMARVVWGWR